MKRMYVIKKGNRYVLNDSKYSFTQYLNRAHVWTHQRSAKDCSLPDKGEIIVKVSKNKTGKLVEVN